MTEKPKSGFLLPYMTINSSKYLFKSVLLPIAAVQVSLSGTECTKMHVCMIFHKNYFVRHAFQRFEIFLDIPKNSSRNKTLSTIIYKLSF
mgnify:CR=1 FL=1